MIPYSYRMSCQRSRRTLRRLPIFNGTIQGGPTKNGTEGLAIDVQEW